MNYEVEQKFRVADMHAVEKRLAALGAQIQSPVLQTDTYFAHPCRDFAETDEAFRMRTVGEKNFLTYKGPKIDAHTKTRQEIELPIHDGEGFASQFVQMLNSLGFQEVSQVRKSRRTADTPWGDKMVEVALDEVAGAGDFVELELSADENSLDAARSALAELAAELHLSENERRSYLELVLLQAQSGE